MKKNKNKSSIGFCQPNQQPSVGSISTAVVAAAVLVFAVSVACFQASAEDWPKFGRDLGNTARSAETGIDSKSVKSLKTRWTFATKKKISTTPAVATINGTQMVFIGAWDGMFYALNAVTGTQIWSFKTDVVGGTWCSETYCRIGSSPAVDTSKKIVFFGSANAYLYALDAVSGTLVWKASVGDSPSGYEVWSSPAIYQNRVYIGVSSHGDNPCLEGGAVQAYDEATGNLVWSFDTLDQSTCPNGGTCVGGSVWSSVAIDDVNGIVYAGTGNPGSTCQPPSKNAGLYPDSILALNATTGTLLNYFQALKNDMKDRDFGASPVLHMTGVTNQCTGQSVNQYWVTEASKDGYVYIAERNANGLTGNVQKHKGDGDFTATAAVDADKVVTSCGGGKKIINQVNTIYVPGPDAYWVYRQDGQGKTTLLRQNKISQLPLRAAPSSIQDIVLFGANDGNLYVSGAKGKILTMFKIGSSIYGGVAISENRIYFGTVAGNVYCMSVDGQ